MRIFLRIRQKLILLAEKIECKFMPQEIHYINGPETLPPPLTKAEEKNILMRIENGDETAREPLIVHNLRLVVYIAKKFEIRNYGKCSDDEFAASVGIDCKIAACRFRY